MNEIELYCKELKERVAQLEADRGLLQENDSWAKDFLERLLNLNVQAIDKLEKRMKIERDEVEKRLSRLETLYSIDRTGSH